MFTDPSWKAGRPYLSLHCQGRRAGEEDHARIGGGYRTGDVEALFQTICPSRVRSVQPCRNPSTLSVPKYRRWREFKIIEREHWRTEGLATVRIQTELALAHGIQATLVPTLSLQVDRFEVYGKSIPSTEMGGDLIDAVERDGTLLAYVADISGHGLAAGQLMGMLKTAVRVSLQFRQEPVAVLESADRVLPAVKEANMYATLALLYFDGSSEAEYSLAGHPPILHYRAVTGDIGGSPWSSFPWA